MTEQNIMKTIMLALGKIPGVRIFRNNVGTAYAGAAVTFNQRGTVQVEHGDVLVKQARIFHAGLCKGSSDLIGFRSITVTPEMVGKTVAVFTGAEIKTKTGRVSPEQAAFMNMVNQHGGIAFVARSEGEAVEFISARP